MAITINGNGTVSGLTAAPNLTSSGLTTGKILQVKQTVKTDTTNTTSITTFVDMSGMSVSITPSATNSKILVMVDMRLSTNTNRNIVYRLVRGSTAIYIGDAASQRTRATGGIRLTDDAKHEAQSETAIFLDSPGVDTSLTYKVQWTQTYSSSGESMYINRSYADGDSDDRQRYASSILVQEVAA